MLIKISPPYLKEITYVSSKNELKKLYERLKNAISPVSAGTLRRQSDSKTALLQGRGKPIWRKAICKRKSV